MAGGRPTLYKPEYCDDARRMCFLGATNQQIADHFDVNLSTLEKWITTKPEFLLSLKEGREKADANVANSLYNKAMDGDTTACIFWLKNRRAAHWRDKQEVDHTGQLDLTVITRKIVK